MLQWFARPTRVTCSRATGPLTGIQGYQASRAFGIFGYAGLVADKSMMLEQLPCCRYIASTAFDVTPVHFLFSGVCMRQRQDNELGLYM